MMTQLNPYLLTSIDSFDRNELALKKNEPYGSYNPMQFVLRLRKDIHEELNNVKPGIYSQGNLSGKQIQAFSTYLHETIHWWQHVGSNFGVITSLKFPSQAHINNSLLKTLLINEGAFKSIRKFDIINRSNHRNVDVNRILNNWHDVENAAMIALSPQKISKLTKDPYFESVGHSYNMMWSSAIWLLASTLDQNFSFFPNIKNWEQGFQTLRKNKVEGFYYGSSNKIPQFGTKAIFEGQARFSQLQYLYAAFEGNYDLNDFRNIGMLNGIYVEAFNYFLMILNESSPTNPIDPLVSLFLLICDIAINPVDGFPFDVYHHESFVITNDPGTRFYLLCIMIRDKHQYLKKAIKKHSKEEYIEISKILSDSISCLSPYESCTYIISWIKNEKAIIQLLEEESNLLTNQKICQ